MSLDLDELKRLEAAATPGPWRACEAMRDEGRCSCGLVGQDDGGIIADFGPDELIADCGGPMRETRPVNASFVAAARNAMPELIAEVERLRNSMPREITKDDDREAVRREIEKRHAWSSALLDRLFEITSEYYNLALKYEDELNRSHLQVDQLRAEVEQLRDAERWCRRKHVEATS